MSNLNRFVASQGWWEGEKARELAHKSSCAKAPCQQHEPSTVEHDVHAWPCPVTDSTQTLARGKQSQKNKKTSKITFRSHPNAQRPAGWSGRETHLSDCALTHCSNNPAPEKVGRRGEHLSDCPCDFNLKGFGTPPRWTGGNKVFVVRRSMCQKRATGHHDQGAHARTCTTRQHSDKSTRRTKVTSCKDQTVTKGSDALH